MLNNKRVMYTDNFLIEEVSVLGWTIFDSAVSNGLPAHVHPREFEICFIVQGHINWWLNDRVYNIGRGDYFITKPGELHGGVNGVMERCELYWVQISLSDKENPAGGRSKETAELISNLHHIQQRAFPARSTIQPAFYQLIQEHMKPGEHAAILFRATLHQILVDVIRSYDHFRTNFHQKDKLLSPEISRGLVWIEDHLTEKFSVADIAAAANMSTSYFQKRFLRETGQTPAEYCNRKRIERAQEMLAHGGLTISHIALALGFSSSQYFATVFKKYRGVTPREYIKILG